MGSTGLLRTYKQVLIMLLAFSVCATSTPAKSSRLNQTRSNPCSPSVLISQVQRKGLISRLRISKAGKNLIKDFKRKFNSLDKLYITWNTASFSEISTQSEDSYNALRGIASGTFSYPAVCIHLTQELPDIEHIADLAHELTHATRLPLAVLRGDAANVDEFVKSRLASRGGEADAFAVECKVKREILGKWDDFCSPYVKADSMDVQKIIDDLYDGTLAASLTGEPYPTMLAKQYRSILLRRKSR